MNMLEIGVKPISPVMVGECNTTNTLIGYGRTIEALANKYNFMRCDFIFQRCDQMGAGLNLAKPYRTIYQRGGL